MSSIKVLIVDDSLIFRHAVQETLAGEDGIEIVGSVRNGKKAMEFLESGHADVVTLDLEMPEMDGLATLREIQQRNSQPGTSKVGVIMLSAHTRKGADTTLQALELGAFDFIQKPSSSSEDESIALLKRSLVPKIHHFGTTQILTAGRKPESCEGVPASTPVKEPGTRTEGPFVSPGKTDIIVIGVSTGGPRSLSEMLPLLCERTDAPILIVQHMPPTFTTSLAESLDKKCRHKVKEGNAGDYVTPNTVYVAPGGVHMVVRKSGAEVMVGTNSQPPENGCRPSVDVLFRSVATTYAHNITAIIMTGMGNDGSKSLRALKRNGARIIAQDEASSVVWGMPGSAVKTGLVDEVLSLLNIPKAVG
jgi:two-component system chemotaxis response regulator CheB